MTVATRFKTTLEGTCTMHEAHRLRDLLLAASREALAALPRVEGVEIGMTEVTGIDACGCQLITLFMENMKREGITASPCGVPPQIGDRIALLGFAEYFGRGPVAGKEKA